MRSQRFPFTLSYWTGGPATTLRAGAHFRFDLDALNGFCFGDLPSNLVDLLRIAASVYVVDRLVKRKPKAAARTIGLKIEVFRRDLWGQPRVRDALQDALEFVTGDFWDIDFEQDTQPYKWPANFLPLAKCDGPPLICLYSGGLDSAAGLVARMNENPGRPVVPVTVWHQARQRRLVRRHYDFLRGHYRTKGFGTLIDPLIVRVAMKWKSAAEKKNQETSQRGRSFLFTALGAVTALMHGQRAVEVFESGVGAINLPLMSGMVGPKATRSSHPGFLRRMSELLSLVADTEMRFILPFADRTKGELVRALAPPHLRPFAAMSASCVHFPMRSRKYKQCGLCPACIFRRVALGAAGIPEPDSTYQYDFLGPADRINALPDKRLADLKAFLLQIARLRDIENHDHLPPAFERHVVGTGIIPTGQSQKGVIRLLARYRDEWMGIASDAWKRGHAWAGWLAPCPPAAQGVTHASA